MREDKTLDSWRGSVMYLAMIDRFCNGEPANDDQGAGEFDPKDEGCFHGGDLAGLRRKLPYLRTLGIDSLWITPPIRNQWRNPYIPQTRGYHGYWPYDFTAIDPHFGGLEEYQALVREAHALGIRVIQDIVVNHTGNFFTVGENGYAVPEGSIPPGPPNDPVFRMNDPRDPEQKKAAVYNFTPNIADFGDRKQTLTRAMGDLDDINLRSPLAAARMREIYRHWIDAADIDGFRVDTVFYTPEEFYAGFLHERSRRGPGVKVHARRRGKRDFFVFGEVWSYDYKAIGRYLAKGGERRLDAAVDLPLNEALGEVFFKGAPTRRLAAPLGAARRNAGLWVNFLDNHDTERVDSRAAAPSVRQAFVALFTLPGIPCLYYGTEAGLRGSREDLFGRFDETSERFRFLQGLIRLRKAHPALGRGVCRLDAASYTAGVLAYSMVHPEESCRVVLNTSPDPVLHDPGADPAGLEPLLASDGARVADPLTVPAYGYLVLRQARRGAPRRRPPLRLSVPGRGPVRGKTRVRCRATGAAQGALLSLLADGRLDAALPSGAASKRELALELDTAALGNGRHELRLLARTPAGRSFLSPPAEILVRNPYRLLREVRVPKENKGGLGARIRAPADPSYGEQLSLLRARAETSGRDLRLTAFMGAVTDDWNPPQGYDHVYFSVFFAFPRRPGKPFFPKMSYARRGFEFNAGFLLFGWGSRSFGAAGSTLDSYGPPLACEPRQSADKRRRAVIFDFPDRCFAGLATLAGVKIFLSTWDGYLGELRGISEKPETWEFSSAAPQARGLPKVYDHVEFTL